MEIGDYPTPAQVTVMLDSTWIDDALRVEYTNQAAKIPIYGYNEVRPSAFVDGRAFVTGSLAVNYRFPGYLTYAACNFGLGDWHEQSPEEAVQLINKIRNATVDERVNMLEEARLAGNLDKMGKVMQESLAGIEPDQYMFDIQEYPANIKFNIKIYFDTPDNSLYYREIQGVRFTSAQLVINNSAGAGGDMSSSGRPLVEVYTFLAEHVVDRTSNAALSRRSDRSAGTTPTIGTPSGSGT